MKDLTESIRANLESEQLKALAFIKEDGPSGKRFCVYTHQTNKNMGCYKTRKEAEDRLIQIHMFAKDESV